jgi:hypothetical protein
VTQLRQTPAGEAEGAASPRTGCCWSAAVARAVEGREAVARLVLLKTISAREVADTSVTPADGGLSATQSGQLLEDRSVGGKPRPHDFCSTRRARITEAAIKA